MPIGPGGEVTIGELYRSISSLDSRVSAQFDSVNRRLDTLQFVHRETYTAEKAAQDEKIEKIEERLRFWTRAFYTSLILPVAASIIVLLAVTK